MRRLWWLALALFVCGCGDINGPNDWPCLRLDYLYVPDLDRCFAPGDTLPTLVCTVDGCVWSDL